MRIIRLKEVLSKTGLSRSSVYKLQSEGAFPKSFQLTGRAVGWYAYEVDAWMQKKLDAREESGGQQEAISLLSRHYHRWS